MTEKGLSEKDRGPQTDRAVKTPARCVRKTKKALPTAHSPSFEQSKPVTPIRNHNQRLIESPIDSRKNLDDSQISISIQSKYDLPGPQLFISPKKTITTRKTQKKKPKSKSKPRKPKNYLGFNINPEFDYTRALNQDPPPQPQQILDSQFGRCHGYASYDFPQHPPQSQSQFSQNPHDTANDPPVDCNPPVYLDSHKNHYYISKTEKYLESQTKTTRMIEQKYSLVGSPLKKRLRG